MTGQEKAAVLLLQLPAEEADAVLERLGPDRSERLRTDMQRLQSAPPSDAAVEAILRELDELLSGQATAPEAAPEEGTAEAPGTVGEATASGPAATSGTEGTPAAPPAAPARGPDGEPLPDDAAIESDPLSALRQMAGGGQSAAAANVDKLALALTDEHPRTVALVLNQMEPDRAGEVLKRLPPEHRREVSIQLGREMSVSPDLVNRIVRTVLEKCRKIAEAPPGKSGGNRFKRMAEMLRRLDKPDRMEVLATLEQNDPDTAASVKEFLYSFEDLLLIEDRSMQKLLAEIDSKSLATALKGAPDPIKDKVRNNLSKRARETLNEEMELLGSVPPSTIQQAQKSVVEVIQRLDQAGELTMLE